ncbi:FMN-binding glutamate synthase family protein [Microaerobacter geothermalis]|uniref:FMN-binding glutamate synthase family protein n=1 Tax=Microaerobacter geothermalis TaxID=674972 RepID=UPI001F1C1F5B|nr:FMN-binding glutamate synthase family protein [Microaerobacter geothermalis]MCF6093771.1 FMN-binding glutamate synthase family protein [Microaerobacter geothermalis]
MFKFLSNFARSIVNEAVDKAIERIARDQYTENLFELVPVTQKVGLVNLMEIVMRSSQGQPPTRPLGSHIRFSPWDKLLFNPVHLYFFPTPENVSITTAVTIGPRARKPLTISIPIMIAGMSFGGALSKNAKIALAKAASKIGTATNSGEAGLMGEERDAAALFIGQYNRGGWLNTKEKYARLDAIEIQLGQGAQGSSPQRTSTKNIGPEYREVFGIPEGGDALIHSRLPGIDTKEQFMTLVRKLKDETEVPVGLKIAATHHLEHELQIAIEAGVDFITVDGAEGGTHAAAPSLEDDLGLPTLFAVSRASKFLAKKGIDQDVSLIATGGLVTPGEYLKAIALGANAVYIGTAAIMALVGDQMAKAAPFEPPTDLVVYNAKMTERLDIDRGATNVFNFLNAAVREMELICYSLGKTSVADVSRLDLCTLDPFLSRAIGVDLGFVSHEEQQEYFKDFSRLPVVYPPDMVDPAVYSSQLENPIH